MSIYINTENNPTRTAEHTCHPLDKDVDVSIVLRGSETADQVGVVDAAQHGHLTLQPLQLLLLLCLGVADIAHLRRRRDGNGSLLALTSRTNTYHFPWQD